MASERQRPTRRMVSVSTPPHSKAMAPPARRLRALTSATAKPRDGRQWTEARSREVMWAEVT